MAQRPSLSMALDSMKATKTGEPMPQPADQPSRRPGRPRKVPAPAEAAAAPAVRGQTLRLNPAAWKQLKLLAIERDHTAHDLLLEAVNDLFAKYGKSKIA